jgi:hypothetical protein
MMEPSTFFAPGIAQISMDFQKFLSIWSLNAHQVGALNWRVNLLPMESVEKSLLGKVLPIIRVAKSQKNATISGKGLVGIGSTANDFTGPMRAARMTL